MIIIGLTGGIATGKSTTAGFFRDRAIPVHDADAAVHTLLAPNGAAIPAITAAFGQAVLDDTGGVDRRQLGNMVFDSPPLRKTLEGILHPLVATDRDQFFDHWRDQGAAIVVLDVPLLFETGGDALCDLVVVASVGDTTQKARTMERPGMTTQKMNGILASQMPLADKCARADFILDTGHGLDHARDALYAWLDSDVVTRLTPHSPDSTAKGPDNA